MISDTAIVDAAERDECRLYRKAAASYGRDVIKMLGFEIAKYTPFEISGHTPLVDLDGIALQARCAFRFAMMALETTNTRTGAGEGK